MGAGSLGGGGELLGVPPLASAPWVLGLTQLRDSTPITDDTSFPPRILPWALANLPF